MALPKLNNTPYYDVVIPSTGEKTKFRPYLVKEEKVLLIASESTDTQTISEAMLDIVSACVEAADKNAAQKGDIHVLFRSLSSKLDALSSLQVTNKLHKEDTPLYFDGAALNIEDVTSRVISNVSQRAPEEVNGIQFGKSQSSRRAARQANGADGELTSARKKARRAREKRKHQLSGVDQERRRSEIRLLTEAKSAAAYRAGFPATQQDSLVSSHKSKSVYSQSSKMFSLLQDVR